MTSQLIKCPEGLLHYNVAPPKGKAKNLHCITCILFALKKTKRDSERLQEEIVFWRSANYRSYMYNFQNKEI